MDAEFDNDGVSSPVHSPASTPTGPKPGGGLSFDDDTWGGLTAGPRGRTAVLVLAGSATWPAAGRAVLRPEHGLRTRISTPWRSARVI
jgi:hypothetical protein